MEASILAQLADTVLRHKDRNAPIGAPVQVSVKKVNGRALGYHSGKVGQWILPEYNLKEIQIAQDTDSYIFKAIQLKTNRLLLAGWEFTGLNEENVKYIQNRVFEIEMVSGMPFTLLIEGIAADLLRYSNAMIVKVRDRRASTGKIRELYDKEIEPVAGYFLLPFETLEFKVRKNGVIKKILQRLSSGGAEETREFAPEDVIHFYTNKKPGFTTGTPELLPVLDDVRLLRQIEEDVDLLIDGTLQPIFHWKIGTDTMPERVAPDGESESAKVRRTIEYMPASGIYVTDHRHAITAVGAEGKALVVDAYLEYFKKRVFAGLGVAAVDMGEDKVNRAAAAVMSKLAAQHVEALQLHLKIFIDKFIINELLLESGRGAEVFLPRNRVEIKFGIVDKEERMKVENQTIQLWTNQLLSLQEARKRLNETPMTDEDMENTFFKLYEEPLALIKALGLAAADEALSNIPTSAITPQGVKKQEEQKRQSLRVQGRPPSPASAGQKKLSASKSRPSNQHGTREGPKLTSDALDGEIETGFIGEAFTFFAEEVGVDTSLGEYRGELANLIEEFKVDAGILFRLAKQKLEDFKDFELRESTIVGTLQYRYDLLYDKYVDRAKDLVRERDKLVLGTADEA